MKPVVPMSPQRFSEIAEVIQWWADTDPEPLHRGAEELLGETKRLIGINTDLEARVALAERTELELRRDLSTMTEAYRAAENELNQLR